MFTLTSLTLSGGHVPPPILQLQPGDVILIQSPQPLTKHQSTEIMEKNKQLFPDHRVVIFSDGLTLTAVRPQP